MTIKATTYEGWYEAFMVSTIAFPGGAMQRPTIPAAFATKSGSTRRPEGRSSEREENAIASSGRFKRSTRSVDESGARVVTTPGKSGNARNTAFNNSQCRLNHLPFNVPFRVDVGNPKRGNFGVGRDDLKRGP